MPNFNENNIGFIKFCQENLNKTMFINVLMKWFKKTKVHTLSIKLSISKCQIVKPSDVLFYIFALLFWQNSIFNKPKTAEL
jgi:hypothetical protein